MSCLYNLTLIPDLCSNILCLLSYLSKFHIQLFCYIIMHSCLYIVHVYSKYIGHTLHHSTERFAIAILLRLQRTTLFDGNNPETQVEQDDTSNEGKKPNPTYIYINYFFHHSCLFYTCSHASSISYSIFILFLYELQSG